MNNTFPSSLRLSASLVALVAGVSGCTTLYENEYDFREGWRKAEVVQVASAAELERPEFYNSVRGTPPPQRAEQKFVVMKWLRMGKKAMHAQPLQAGQRWAPGDTVYVNMSACNGEIVKRAA